MLKRIKKSNFFLIKKIKLLRKKYKYSAIYKDTEAVNGKISYKDEMFQGDLAHYKSVGKSAMDNIIQSIELAHMSFNDIKFALDLPCGHGRVMRHLVKYIEPDKITGCDLDKDGVFFCSKEFGSIPLISSIDFNKINFKVKFNLIWVGSLFTHLNIDKFKNLLNVLYNALEKNGIIVFTTHGDYSMEIIRKNPEFYGLCSIDVKKINNQYEKGFSFVEYDESNDYGISLSTEKFIYECIENISGGNLKLLMFKYRGWDQHQDVYSFKRID